jgi:Glycosyl transferases group 1
LTYERKIKVAYVGLKLESIRVIGRFEVHGVPNISLKGYRKSFRSLFTEGLNSVFYNRSILYAQHVDELYRSKNRQYLESVNEFIDFLSEFDIVIFSTFCAVHPELLNKKLSKPIKILGFTDDPHATYTRGIPFLWAFDAAYYISPSYSQEMGFADLMNNIGFKKAKWLPLSQPIDYPVLTEEDIERRSVKVAYVGCPTGTKIDRLCAIDAAFGSDLALFGRWRFGGYYGFVRPLFGEKIFPRKVNSISTTDRDRLYRATAIGFNMHVSDYPSECGNMRTYETAGYGMMPLCDRAGLGLQTQIFAESTEAVYYDSIAEAIDLIRYYSEHRKERISIAWAAHRKFHESYRWEKVTEELLQWALKN